MQNNISLNNDILDNLKIKAINRTITIQDGPVYHDEYFDADLPSNPLFVMVKFGVYPLPYMSGDTKTWVSNLTYKMVRISSTTTKWENVNAQFIFIYR